MAAQSESNQSRQQQNQLGGQATMPSKPTFSPGPVVEKVSSVPSVGGFAPAQSSSTPPPPPPVSPKPPQLGGQATPQVSQAGGQATPQVSQAGGQATPQVSQAGGQVPVPPAPMVKQAKPTKPKKKGNLGRFLFIFILLAVLAGAGYFAYRYFVQGEPVGRRKITYWGLWEDEEILAPIFEEFERQHPNLIVEYKRQQKEDYRARLQNALASETGPDVFRFHNTWVPMLKNELATVPSSVMSVAEFNQVFYPVAMEDLVIGNSIYGIPLEIDTLALFVNEEILRQAGETPPTYWNEIEMVKNLTVRDEQGQIKIAGIGMGGTGNIDHWPDILGLMFLQNGVDFPRIQGKLGSDVVDFYTTMLTGYKAWDPLLSSSTREFAGGRLAMYFGYSWDVFEIQHLNPELKFKIVPVPQIQPRPDAPSVQPVTWASYWVEGVAERSENQDQAWQLVEYLSTPEVMRQMYENQVKIGGRAFGEPYSRREMASELMSDPLVAPFLQQAETAKSWYLCSRTFDSGLNEGMIAYFGDLVNAVNEGEPVADELEIASQGVESVLKQYGIK